VVLIGTKLDLKENGTALEQLQSNGIESITSRQGHKLSQDINAVQYIECSAKTGSGVNRVFDVALHVILNNSNTKKKNCNIS